MLYRYGEERPAAWYEVALGECRTSAETLDWIIQLVDKTWVTNDVLGDLVRALRDCLHPQANLCSFGVSKYISLRAQPGSWKKVRERIKKLKRFENSFKGRIVEIGEEEK